MVIGAVTVVSALTYLGLSANLFDGLAQADLRIEPTQQTTTIGETFTVDVVVESNAAANVFAGDLSFDPTVLTVQRIDYNTSIADLWAERPWYHNGDGTLNFAGGTTQPGGFVGTGKLITITFAALKTGSGAVMIDEARILKHDGLGTETVLAEPIDSIVTVTPRKDTQEVLRTSGPRTNYVVTEEHPQTDLNDDGQQTIADVSIFMGHLATRNERSDFNEDGKVNLADLSILMDAE